MNTLNKTAPQPIADLVQANVLTCPPETTVSTAAALMRERRCGSIVVVEGGFPVGIWTEHDATRLDFAAPMAFDQPISALMSAPLKTIPITATATEAGAMFQSARLRHLVAVDEGGAMTGILSQTDLAWNSGVEQFLRLRAVGESLGGRILVLPGHTPIGTVAQRMAETRLDAAIIQMPDGVLGIVTERDLLGLVARKQGEGRIDSLAVHPLHTIPAHRPLLEARQRLIDGGFRHLGVVDESNDLVGLLTLADILRHLQGSYLEDLEDILRTRETQLDKAEDSLREERDLIAAGPAVVLKWGMTANWPVLYASPNVRGIFGYDPEDLVAGRPPFAELVHPDELERVAQEVADHLAAGDTRYTQHYRFRHADGSWRWIDDFTTVSRDANGTVTGLNGYVLDVTERVETEVILNKERERYQSLVNNIPGITYRCKMDKDWTMLFMSQAVDPLTGYPASDFINNAVRSYESIIHPEAREKVDKAVVLAVSENRPWDIAYRVCHKDGSVRWVQEKGQAVYEADGTVAYLDGFILDITARREAENALKASEERYRLAQTATGVGIWDWDIQNDQIVWDDSCWTMLGHEPQDTLLCYRDWQSRLHPEDAAPAEQEVYRQLATGQGFVVEFRLRTADGGWLWIQGRGRVVARGDDGAPTRMMGTHTNIHARKVAEEEQARQQRFLKSLTESLGEGVYAIDREGRCSFLNPEGERLLGRTQAELFAKGSIHDVIHSQTADGQPLAGEDCPLYHAMDQGRDVRSDSEVFRRADGSTFPVDLTAVPLWNDDGDAVIGQVVAFTDITARKRMERILQDSRNRLDHLLAASPAVIYAANPTTFQASYISANARDLFGLEPDEILAHPSWWADSLHPDDRDRVLAEAEDWFATGLKGTLKHSYRLRRGDGTWVWVEDQLRAITDDKGIPLELVGSHTDITAAREIEAAVRESEERFRSLFLIFPDGVTLIDPETTCPLHFNPLAARQLGYSEEEFSTLPIAAYQAEMTAEQIGEKQAQILKVGGDDFETLHRRKDGSLMPVHVTVMRFEHQGRPSVLSVTRDITQQREAREALERSNSELEHFAYAASHDLRQPLRMINSYTQLLDRSLKDSLGETEREFMGYIRDGAQRMDQMLVSLLEYSRVGRQGEPMECLNSRALAEEALAFLKPLIEESAGQVRLHGDWPTVTASRNEGVRLFQNLIGNALKYRAPDRAPEIDITVRAKGPFWEFAITDNGIGIDPGQTDRLFKVFQRLHTRSKYEGTGVGLAVCRKIIERHGGSISVESEGEGTGTTFRFTLPRGKGKKEDV